MGRGQAGAKEPRARSCSELEGLSEAGSIHRWPFCCELQQGASCHWHAQGLLLPHLPFALAPVSVSAGSYRRIGAVTFSFFLTLE